MDIRQLNINSTDISAIKSLKEKVEKDFIISRPLQLVKIDWTFIDIMLINPRTVKAERPKLIYSIDEFTGHPLGFFITFDAVDSLALKQCLLHSIMPKRYLRTLYPEVENDWITYGTPEEIALVNPRVNDFLDFEDACLQLGINLQFLGAGARHQKGMVERAFRKLNTKFIHSLKVSTHLNSSEKVLYDSKGKACISLDDFLYIVHIALVDIVSQEFDRERGGSPFKLWKDALINNPNLSSSLNQTVDELKLALMGGIEERMITNEGVPIQNVYFQSFDLMDLKHRLISKYGRSKKVCVRFDLADMRTIYVWDEFKKSYVKAHQVGVEKGGYEPTSLIHYSGMKLNALLTKNLSMEELINKAEREILTIREEEAKKLKNNKNHIEGRNNIGENVNGI